MNLTNKSVNHKVFGKGEVVDHNSANYMLIRFAQGDKKFKYPDAFATFLSIEDDDLHAVIQNELADALEENRIAEEQRKQDAEEARRKALEEQETKKKAKVYSRANVAFKCNYSDGGRTNARIGYYGVCSDETIRNNIEIEKRTWCGSADCECGRYLRNEITRSELDALFDKGKFLCYESQMLLNWKALAGIVQQGERKGQPMKLNQVQRNSLCVLTTRNPNTEEEDRYIFAVFLVDETYEGDGQEEGYVTTNSPYKIMLGPKEAESMRFWEYHANESKSEISTWSSGLHRYFDDVEALQILNDIYHVKIGTPEEKLAKEFLVHFASIAKIDLTAIPKKRGALVRKGEGV